MTNTIYAIQEADTLEKLHQSWAEDNEEIVEEICEYDAVFAKDYYEAFFTKINLALIGFKSNNNLGYYGEEIHGKAKLSFCA